MEQKRAKEGKKSLQPQARTAVHPMSSQGHTQFSTRKDDFFPEAQSIFCTIVLQCTSTVCFGRGTYERV